MKGSCLNLFMTFMLTGVSFCISAQTTHKKAQAEIERMISEFKGVAGVYAINLNSNKMVSVNSDTLYPTASLIKVPIMIGVFDLIQNGELNYDQELVYRDSLDYDNGVVGSFKDSTVISLSELVYLMESISDNTGSLWLQRIVGGEKINRIMDSLGLRHIKVNSRVKGREMNRVQYGWGECTPKSMVQLFRLLYEGKVVSKSASERMLRTLGNQFWDEEGLSVLPVNIKFASKTGAVDRSRSECTLVFGSKSTYIYCVVTKNQTDISYAKNNEGYKLIRNVAKTLYNHWGE
ncbi:MAG: serine hydrolase [Leadbetterella sp.]